jgi:hypothetical protein
MMKKVNKFKISEAYFIKHVFEEAFQDEVLSIL